MAKTSMKVKQQRKPKFSTRAYTRCKIYTNREGQKVYTTDVVVEEQEFAESKNAGGNNGGYSAPQHNNPAPSANTCARASSRWSARRWKAGPGSHRPGGRLRGRASWDGRRRPR